MTSTTAPAPAAASAASSVTMLYTYHSDHVLNDDIAQNPMFYPLRIPQNRFFESHMFSMPYEMTTTHVGHVAYSYQYKIPAYDFDHLISTYANYDIVALMPASHNMYAFADKFHPGFLDIWSRLIDLLGYGDYTKMTHPIVPFYCNYWIMKREWFFKYQQIAKRAMQLLDTDPILVDLTNKDSSYKGTHDCLPENKLMEISGKPYYTFHPFVLERLVCFVAAAEGAQVKYMTREDSDTILRNSYISAPAQTYLTKKKNDRQVLI